MLGREVEGREGLGREVEGREGLGREVEGRDGLGRDVEGREGLERLNEGLPPPREAPPPPPRGPRADVSATTNIAATAATTKHFMQVFMTLALLMMVNAVRQVTRRSRESR
ncbi:MAG: hypothetical protein N2C14_04940 [Planctomycetales bacterium]